MHKRRVAAVCLAVAISCLSVWVMPVESVADMKKISDGFAGIPWGTDLAALSGFSVLHKKGNALFCTDPGRVYSIGEHNLGYVIFGFYKNQFYSAHVRIDELDAYSTIRGKLMEKFGEPRMKMDIKWQIFTWKDGDLVIKLKRLQDATNMKLSVYYFPLSRHLNEVDREPEDSIRFLPIQKDKRPLMMPILEF